MASETPPAKRLFEFAAKERVWVVVNDGVMGGVSQSSMVNKKGIATFTGRVRLENNGGFASTRSGGPSFSIAEGAKAFRMRVRGDGTIYQFTTTTADGWFWAEVTPKKVVWSEVLVPFTDLVPKSRFGETVKRRAFTPDQAVSSLGFLVGNKREERFSIAIDWIESTP